MGEILAFVFLFEDVVPDNDVYAVFTSWDDLDYELDALDKYGVSYYYRVVYNVAW